MTIDYSNRPLGKTRILGSPPFPEEDLQPLDGASQVNCGYPLDAKSAKQLGTLLATDPGVVLRLYSRGTVGHLEALEHMPELHRLKVEDPHAKGLDGLRFTPELRTLVVAGAKPKLSPAPVMGLEKLYDLELEQPANKGLEGLGGLPALRLLGLSGATWPKKVTSLPKLEGLFLTAVKFAKLPGLPSIKRLGLYSSANADLAEISQLTTLEWLRLFNLRGLNVLPDLGRLSNLRYLGLEPPVSADDLKQLSALTSLEELAIKSRDVPAKAFEPLKEHPSLKKLRVKLANKAESKLVADMLDNIEVAAK